MRLPVIASIVLACAGAPAVAQNYSAMVAKAKSAVSQDFKDPESARFRNLGIYKSTTGKGGVSVCGEVNAKNAFGAYVGYRRFVANDDFDEIEEDTESVMVTALCHELVRKVK